MTIPDNPGYPELVDGFRDPGTTALPVKLEPYRYRGWRVLSGGESHLVIQHPTEPSRVVVLSFVIKAERPA